MNAQTDPQLLRAYAERRSEAAFAELVRRHIDFVHSAAVRMVNEPHLAKDVSQGVFVALAESAGKLTNHPVLSGWLHRTARNIAAQTIRTEVRRRHREQEAAAMNEHPATEASWEEIAPHLDAALADLSEPDRDAVLLRYFENKPAQEMAAILGISAEAAQKRVSRAVERLRENLANRGVTAGAAGLAGVISANAVQGAPAGLAAAVSGAALAGTVSTAVAATKFIAMTTLKKVFVATVATALAATAIYQSQRRSGSADDVRSPSSQSPSERKQREARSVVEQLATARAEKPPVDRKKELERLKLRWLELRDPHDTNSGDKAFALSKESAAILLCSEEVIELLGFLDEHKLWNVVSQQVAEQFKSPRAAEARALLIELPETVDDPSGKRYRDRWSNAAGQTCPPEEFDAFRDALNCKVCGLEALYGRNAALMSTQPEFAFLSTLEIYESNPPTSGGDSRVSALFMRGDIAADVDFAKLEQRLPVDSPGSGTGRPTHQFYNIRSALFEKWGKMDPAGAANYVMAHPDRLDPKIIATIVRGYSGKNSMKGLAKWVSEFTEGQYYDIAAKAAVEYSHMSGIACAEIKALVEMIGDPIIREEAVKTLNEPR